VRPEPTRGALALVEAPDRPLRLVAPRPLRVADIALFYGERSGGIRTYLDAKARHAALTATFEHHVIVPGDREVRGPGGAAPAGQPNRAALDFAPVPGVVYKAALATVNKLQGA
jgi:hypothetical protein